MNEREQLLGVEELTVEIASCGRYYKALDAVSFAIHKGEIAGLVGESGCGKSLTALSIMGLLPDVAKVSKGHIALEGKDLLSLTEEQKCKVRGREVSIVFQEPMTALNPLMPVGLQIAEAFMSHHTQSKSAAREAAIEMMQKVGLSRAQSLFWEYPHQLSGGMKQRIVIAMALINHPQLLIADEPTTALDVTIQYQILQLIRQLNTSLSTAVLLVSHDLGIVREMCSKIIVMYGGFVVEEGPAQEVLSQPMHPYTKQLLSSIPTAKKRGQELYTIPGVVAPLNKRKGNQCPFCDRCAQQFDACKASVPPLTADKGRKVRCFLTGGEAVGASTTAD